MQLEQEEPKSLRELALEARVEKRTAAKEALFAAKKAKDKAQRAVDNYWNRKKLAKAKGEFGGFQCVASDTAGRNGELELYLACDEDWLALTASLDGAQKQVSDLENEISEIDYWQRERQLEAYHQLGKSFERLDKTVKTFTEAVGIYAEVRGR